MTVDEYGREPGVDYSSQTWLVHGYTWVTVEDATLAASLDPSSQEFQDLVEQSAVQ